MQPETLASHKGKARGVKEVEAVAATGHVPDVLAMQNILGDIGAGGGLLCPEAVFVVLEADGFASFAHLGQLSSMLTGVAPGAVVGWVADVVIGDANAVERCEHIPPVITAIGYAVNSCRAIGVGVVLCRRQPADAAGGVGVGFLRQYVSAQIAGEHPHRADHVCRRIRLVVHSRQAADLVICVLGDQIAGIHLCDVHKGVIRVGQCHTSLGDFLDQPGRAVCSLPTCQIRVGGVNVSERRRQRAFRNSSQPVVGVTKAARPISQGRHPVFSSYFAILGYSKSSCKIKKE